MRSGLGTSLRSARAHGQSMNMNRLNEFERNALQERYARTHDNKFMNQQQFNTAVMNLGMALDAAVANGRNRIDAALDMSTYRAVIAQPQETTEPTGRVE